MSIQPEGENLRKAVKWISERRGEKTAPPLKDLIDQAGVRFDLSPKDEDFLFRFFTGETE